MSVDLRRVEGAQCVPFSGKYFLTKLKRGPELPVMLLAKTRNGEPSTALTLCPRTLVTRASFMRTSAGLQSTPDSIAVRAVQNFWRVARQATSHTSTFMLQRGAVQQSNQSDEVFYMGMAPTSA